MTPKEVLNDISQSVFELRNDLNVRVSQLSKQFEDVISELESRFRKPDKDDLIFRQLPNPKKLSMGFSDTLSNRQTRRTFSDEPISDIDLSTLLWAADGINRPNGKRTMPSALNWQETEIFVLKANGIWHWLPEKQGLEFLSLRDVRGETFAGPTLISAPVHLVFVSNTEKTDTLLTRIGTRLAEQLDKDDSPEKLREILDRSMILNVGVRLGALSLAASAMDLSCVVRSIFDREKVADILSLGKEKKVQAIVTLGYRPQSIFDTIR